MFLITYESNHEKFWMHYFYVWHRILYLHTKLISDFACKKYKKFTRIDWAYRNSYGDKWSLNFAYRVNWIKQIWEGKNLSVSVFMAVEHEKCTQHIFFYNNNFISYSDIIQMFGNKKQSVHLEIFKTCFRGPDNSGFMIQNHLDIYGVRLMGAQTF
jgi:hypothetical protein